MYSTMRNPNFISLLFASLLLSSLSFLTISRADDEDLHGDDSTFNYMEGSKKGPKEWAHINSSWQICATGKFQSPIDINRKAAQVSQSLVRLKRDYQPAPATIRNRGHDVIVEWQGDAGEITLNGTMFKLVQCHWHTPSEHTLDGMKFPMEMHVLHTNSKGEKAVVALLYRYGRADPFLKELIGQIKRKSQTIKEIGEEGLDLGVFSPSQIKFGHQKYYRYTGSLTVPPCTEGIIWTINNKVRTVSRDQVEELKDALDEGFKDNARPVQDLAGRQVYRYSE